MPRLWSLRPDGLRRVKLTEFYREDGGDHWPLGRRRGAGGGRGAGAGRRRAAYAKARIRDAIDFPLVGVAAALRREGMSSAT